MRYWITPSTSGSVLDYEQGEILLVVEAISRCSCFDLPEMGHT